MFAGAVLTENQEKTRATNDGFIRSSSSWALARTSSDLPPIMAASRDGPARRHGDTHVRPDHIRTSRARCGTGDRRRHGERCRRGRPCCGRRSRRRSGDLLAVTRRLVDAGLPPLPRLRPARHIQHLADRHHQPRRLVLPLRGLSVQGRCRLRQGGLQER